MADLTGSPPGRRPSDGYARVGTVAAGRLSSFACRNQPFAMFCNRSRPHAGFKAEIQKYWSGGLLHSFNQFKGLEKMWDHRIHIQTVHRLDVVITIKIGRAS